MNKLMNELKRLEKFHYGCLCKNQQIITDQNELDKLISNEIIVQAPTSFLKNEIGMCHDASIYVDQTCNENNINHKCIYLRGNFHTHSFIIIQLMNGKWQIIDVFATNNCLWTQPFDECDEAINNRIDEWIEKDNENNSNIEIYLGSSMPSGGCDLTSYEDKIFNNFKRL